MKVRAANRQGPVQLRWGLKRRSVRAYGDVPARGSCVLSEQLNRASREGHEFRLCYGFRRSRRCRLTAEETDHVHTVGCLFRSVAQQWMMLATVVLGGITEPLYFQHSNSVGSVKDILEAARGFPCIRGVLVVVPLQIHAESVLLYHGIRDDSFLPYSTAAQKAESCSVVNSTREVSL